MLLYDHSECIDDFRHSRALKKKIKELYPNIVLKTEHSDSLYNIIIELLTYNLTIYVNLSAENILSDGSLFVGERSTLKQRAMLSNYDDFFKQHNCFPIFYISSAGNLEISYEGIEDFLDFLYEGEILSERQYKKYFDN